MAKTQLHQNSIAAALAVRHSEDLFIEQCKTGPTQNLESGSVQIMDAWAMAKSWANPCTTGYEIKVSRNDFMQDKKWRGYLPYCNCFYFVCPWKMILPNELPGEECGLIWVTETGNRCIVKQRAKYRDVEIPDMLWRYILMWRVKVARAHEGNASQDRLAMVKSLIEEQADMKAVGKYFAHKISRHVSDVEDENEWLKKENKKLEDVKAMLKALGFEHPNRIHEWSLRQDITNALVNLPPSWGKLRDEARHFTRIFEDVDKQMIELLKQAPPAQKETSDA